MTEAVTKKPSKRGDKLRAAVRRYQKNWPAWLRDVVGVKLDNSQEEVVHSVQVNRRTVVVSGHARGKDFIGACVSLCQLNLTYPSKVINTAPTGRQVLKTMLAECKKLWQNAPYPLGGRFLIDGIRFGVGEHEDPEHFLLGFKAGDTDTESWTGYHSPNILIAVTEASGIHKDTFDAIEGLMTGGNAKLYLAANPHRTNGEVYDAFKSRMYQGKFSLNCLDSPNVIARKQIIPGQVDWGWVNECITAKPGWSTRIRPEEVDAAENDFEWDAHDGRGPLWYRPTDLLRVKVLGKWPKESEDQLIHMAWVEAAQQRWRDIQAAGLPMNTGPLKLGVDVAGMGADATVYCYRYEDVVPRFEDEAKSDHMSIAGKVKTILDAHDKDAEAFVDTIGEGAGVQSRLLEMGAKSRAVKFSEGVTNETDITGERKFFNLRAYCWWALRDALDPHHNPTLALPPGDLLMQDLTAPKWEYRSNAKIIIESKDKIKLRLGRSPDFGDALANTFCPKSREWKPAVLSRKALGV